jgi:hypothetical protein
LPVDDVRDEAEKKRQTCPLAKENSIEGPAEGVGDSSSIEVEDAIAMRFGR